MISRISKKLKKKSNKKLIYFGIVILAIILLACVASSSSKYKSSQIAKSYFISNNTTDKETDYKYLSDLDYIEENNWTYVGWRELQIDKPPEGSIITLKVNGKNKSFLKGIGMHANAQVTYDISKFSDKYTRFLVKAGVDASRGTNGDGVWFKIMASMDGNTWDNLIAKSDVVTGVSNALNFDLDVTSYKYLRIYVDKNGNNTADHAVLADAKLATADYDADREPTYDKLHQIEYYDNILSAHDVEYNYKNNYRLVLEREFVNKIDYDTILTLVDFDEKYKATFDWLLSSNRTIKEVIEVGELASGLNFIRVLSDLYDNYKDDLSSENGYVYEKMMIALAAAYTTDHLLSPLNFGGLTPTYDYVERFEILKYLYDNDKFMVVKNNALMGEFVKNEWFKDYHIQLMRMVVQDPMRNDELVWLNEYTHYRGGYSFYWFAYVSPNYNKLQYQSEENRDKYNERYLLNANRLGKYKVPYGDGITRYWMALDNGGICWNASRFGQSMFRINGIPSVGAYQIGHELYIGYYQTPEGKGYWSTRYGNWEGAGTTWGGGMRVRLIFDWGNKYFTDQKISGSKNASSTGYLYLGQANLNNLKAYQKSLYYDLIANSYTDNNQKVETYLKSLEVNDINLDTYDYLVSLYKEMSVNNENGTITSKDWRSLAEQIITSYEHFPVAMFDLIKVIRPYLEEEDKVEIDALEKEALERATTFQSSDPADNGEMVRVHSRQLLKKVQDDPVSFSFDGEDGGKIIKNPNYDIGIKYSIDGGNTFTELTSEQKVALSKEELASITTENDIIVGFQGLTRTFTIDITKASTPSLYKNDLENKVIGTTDSMEWRYDSNGNWTSFSESVPDLTGNKTIKVRQGYTATYLPSDEVELSYTEDSQPDNEKYIPLSHISIKAVSSEELSHNEGVANVLDGNINTIWHSSWDGGDTERYIILELDEEVRLSAFEYFPRQVGTNGRIKSANLSVSTDGEHWTKLVSSTNWANDGKVKKLQFEPIKAKYVKLTAVEYYGDKSYVSAAMINLYEDTTIESPTATIKYSTTSKTSAPVTVTLTNPSTNITILNNEGSNTYTFTKNGFFSFIVADDYGNISEVVARVDWIEEKSTTDSKPGSSNSGNTSKTNTQTTDNDSLNHSNTNTTKTNELATEEYKTYSSSIVALKITATDLNKEVTFKTTSLTLNANLLRKVGSDSVYFGAYLEDDENINIILDTPMELTVRLDATKKFNELYEVKEDGSLEKIDYKKVKDSLVFNVNRLSKYIVDYGDIEELEEPEKAATVATEEVSDNIKESNHNKLILIIVCTVGVITVGVAGVTICKRKNK